jgi:hypothetical protein
MILFKLPFVIPTRTLWLVMLVLIGIFGFFAQVCHPVSVLLSSRPDRLFQPTKVLLTMGLQRETAGRGALAIYTSVCPSCHDYRNAKVTFTTDCFCGYIRICRLSYHPFNTLDHRGVDNRGLGHLYHRNPSFVSSHRSYAHARPADEAEGYYQAGAPSW